MKPIAESLPLELQCRARWRLAVAVFIALLALAAPSSWVKAQGKSTTDLWVAVMPSYSQSVTYANAAVNEAITVWGRAWNGTPPYSYDLDFGDGTPHLTGSNVTAAAAKFIGGAHTYTSGGSKTVSLTVTDAAARTYTRQAVVRVLLSPTHNDRINMAIEKGLLHLYNRQTQKEPLQTWWWADDSSGSRSGTAAATILAFEENGHLATNDLEQDIYAETVLRGINWLISKAFYINISNQPGGNPDTNGNGKGALFPGESYSHGFATMAVILGFPNAPAATSATIPAGINAAFTGMTYHSVVIDALDALNYSQAEGTWKGWHYAMNTSDSAGADGSTHQWPNLAMLFAKERYNYTPLPWVVTNSVNAYKQIQNVNGAIGYGSNNSWLTAGKTGGGLVGYFLGGKLVGDADVNNGVSYIGSTWYSTVDPGSGASGAGWVGELYAMYAIKKGFQLQHIETISVPGKGEHNWYNDMSAWLLGNGALLDPTLASGFRSTSYAFGQRPDGSWDTVRWPIGAVGTPSNEIETAHAILVLTQAITEPVPVAIIAPIGPRSARTPGPFELDGSGSYHLDANKAIVEWKWILDAGPIPDWNNPTATGQFATVNPGWNTESVHSVTLRVRDNSTPPKFSTATSQITVTLNDVGPVAVPIPNDRSPPIYSAKVGETIVLDGSDSYDVDGDPIVSFAWDLDGDGQFADADDIALDTSGNADGVTASINFPAVYNGQIGLRVCSQPPGGAPMKCSSNPAAIDIHVAPSDLRVVSINAANVVPGVSGDFSAVVRNDPGSGQPFTGVLVRFYNGNPFGNGVQRGGNYFVDLPVGGSVTVNAPMLPMDPAQQFMYVRVDANNNIPEWDEANNVGFVAFGSAPPVVVAKNVTVGSDGNCEGNVPPSAFDNGSYDPDGASLTFSAAPPGPYPLGTTPVVLTVSDGVTSSTANVSVTVLKGVTVTTKYPLAGRSAYRIYRGQVVPHIVCLNDCMGAPVKAGVTVKVRVVGLNSANNSVFQDVIEEAKRGGGTSGTPASDAIMQFKFNHWRLDLSTRNFSDRNTLGSSRYYQSIISVIDNATLAVLGTKVIVLETRY